MSVEDEQFKEGQKIEAVDPLEMSRICPATIGKVRCLFISRVVTSNGLVSEIFL